MFSIRLLITGVLISGIYMSGFSQTGNQDVQVVQGTIMDASTKLPWKV